VHHPRFRFDWPILLLAACVVLAVYWPSLQFDLFEDDYFLLRPWTPEHLEQVWRGPWLMEDRPDYYRPLAIYQYKAMFFLFGLNTQALHVLPLITMTVIAWLIGRLVSRETGSVSIAAAASVFYVIHPATATAIGPWISNQYQGLVSAALLITLLMWQSCRERGWPYWVPLLIPIIFAAFTKESGLMIPLMLVAIHWGRARWIRDVAVPAWTMLAAGVVVFVGLNVWRLMALDWSLQPGGPIAAYPTLMSFLAGPFVVLFDPLRGWVPTLEAVFATTSFLLTAAAVWALVRRAPRTAAALALMGLVVLLLASIPTGVVFSRERLTPHGSAVVLIWAGGLAALAPHLTRRRRVVAMAVGAVAMVASVALTREAIDDFNPCMSRTLQDPDHLFQEARQPPPELVQWIKDLPRPCNPDTLVPLYKSAPIITWGVAEREFRPNDVIQRWWRSRVVALVTRHATGVVAEVRHPDASPETPVVVRLLPSGGPEAIVTLTSPTWHIVRASLAPTLRTWLRQMHRVEMHEESPGDRALEMRPLRVIY
jgi:hypothetical protein